MSKKKATKKERTGVVYALLDPRPGHEKKGYIGCTMGPVEKRYREHIAPSSFKGARRCNWLKNIRTAGLKPELVVLESGIPESLLFEREIDCIARAKACGWVLVNGDGGGRGYAGGRSASERERFSQAQLKRFQDPVEIEKHRQAQLKRFQDPVEIEKHRQSKLKYFRETPGALETHSRVRLKYYRDTPGAREKTRQATLAYYRDTPGAREKNRQSKLKYFQDTPGALEKNRQGQLSRFSQMPERDKLRQAKLKYFRDNPEAREALGRRSASLSDAQVTLMRTLRQQGTNLRVLAAQFNTNESTVSMATSPTSKHRSYRWVPYPTKEDVKACGVVSRPEDRTPLEGEWGRRTTPLTDDQVQAMRLAHRAGETQVQLAKKYGVSQTTVSRVVSLVSRLRSYRWVPYPTQADLDAYLASLKPSKPKAKPPKKKKPKKPPTRKPSK